MLAIGAASNALGTINNVARAVAMAREADALSFVDAVHFAPINWSMCANGTAISWRARLTSFTGPTSAFSTASASDWKHSTSPSSSPLPIPRPERLETGTQNHEGIVGTAAAVDYLASLATATAGNAPGSRRERLQAVFDTLHERGHALLHRLWDGLGAIKGVKLYGPPPDAPRTPTLAFTVAGRPAEEVSRHLAARGIFASHGDFYAMTVVKRLGVANQGLVRLGCASYTTEEEVARVIECVSEIARG